MSGGSIRTERVELMAPAGSFESLSAALRSGADAVYFGIGDLNMRSNSTANFQIDQMERVVRYCRKYQAKSYLTLNVVVFDQELLDVDEICRRAKESGVDAVIAADFAVITAARRHGLPVHLSVQANVCNLEAVRFYAQFVEVVVLARELSLPQISAIVAGIAREDIRGPGGNLIKAEIFIHGALCVAFSGKCYMSLSSYNASANRGGCLQNCRRRYKVTDLENGNEFMIANGYVMSPADLCMIRFINEIVQSGVSILKIEGRGRSADYVANVVAIYKKALLKCISGELSAQEAAEYEQELRMVFNRNFWHGGYYLGEDMGVWSESGGNQSPVEKRHLGRVRKYFSKIAVAELSVEADDLNCGDKLMIIGTTTGMVEFIVTELYCENISVEKVKKGSIASVKVPVKVRPNDQLYCVLPRKFGG